MAGRHQVDLLQKDWSLSNLGYKTSQVSQSNSHILPAKSLMSWIQSFSNVITRVITSTKMQNSLAFYKTRASILEILVKEELLRINSCLKMEMTLLLMKVGGSGG